MYIDKFKEIVERGFQQILSKGFSEEMGESGSVTEKILEELPDDAGTLHPVIYVGTGKKEEPQDVPADNHIESDISDILGEKYSVQVPEEKAEEEESDEPVPEVSDPAGDAWENNLFVRTLRSEYGADGEGVDNIIRKLYTSARSLTKQEFIDLNHEVYDMVIGALKSKQIHSYIYTESHVHPQTGYPQGITLEKMNTIDKFNFDSNGVMDRYSLMSSRDGGQKETFDNRYQPHLINMEGRATFGEGMEFTARTTSNITRCMEDMLKRYNEVHSDSDIEPDLLEQIGRLDRDNDPIGAYRLKNSVSTYISTYAGTVEKWQRQLSSGWLSHNVIYGMCDYFSLGSENYAYNKINVPVSDVMDTIFQEKFGQSDLFRTGKTAEDFFNRFFHRDTAIEDIIRLVGMFISDVTVCCTNRDKIRIPFGAEQKFCMPGTEIILTGKYGDDRMKTPDEYIYNTIMCIISPVKFMSLADNTLVDISYEAEAGSIVKVYSEILLRSVFEGYMDSSFLYRIFFCKCSEMVVSALSEALTEDCVEFIKTHPIYVKLMELEKAETEPEDLSEVPFDIALPDTNDLDQAMRGFLINTFRDIMTVAVGLNQAFIAVLYALSVMVHKLYGMFLPDMSEHMVLGLSANLVHLMDIRKYGRYIAAGPASVYVWRKSDDAGFVIADMPEHLEKFAEHVGKKDSPVFLIQDRHEMVITSGAPVFYSTDRNKELQEVFAVTRSKICKKYLVISNTRPVSPDMLEDIMATGNSTGKSTGSRGKLTNFVKNNLSEVAWPSMTKLQYDRIRFDKHRGTSTVVHRTPSIMYDSNQAEAGKVARFKPCSDRMVYRLVNMSGINSTINAGSIDPSVISVSKSSIAGPLDTYPLDFFNVLNDIHGSRYGKSKNWMLIAEDPSEGFGYGQMVDHEFHRYTVWNSRFVKAFKKNFQSSRLLGKDSLISGELLLPLVNLKGQDYNLNMKVSSRPVSSGYVGAISAYMPLGKHVFNMDEILCCAWDSMKIGTFKVDPTMESCDDDISREKLSEGITVEGVDWKDMIRTVQNRSSATLYYMPDKFKRISRHFDSDDNISLLKWNSRNVYGLNPSVRVDMIYSGNDYTFSEDIMSVSKDVFFTRITEAFDRAFPLKFMLTFRKETVEGMEVIDSQDMSDSRKTTKDMENVVPPEEITPIKAVSEGGVEYRAESDEKDALASSIAKSYGNYILKDKNTALETVKSRAGSLYAEYKEVLRLKEDLEAEMEAIRNGNVGNDIYSSTGRVKMMVDNGLILDYECQEGSDSIRVVVSAPRIWAGGYIYIMSPGIIKVPFNLKNLTSDLYIRAVKDLMVMQLEAFKYLGSRYDIKSLEALYAYNDCFNNVSPSITSDTYDYPHVRGGKGCMGTSSSEMRNAIRNGDISMYIKTAKEYIKSATLKDGWGQAIISWPCIPATMFNLLKHGLISTMDVTMDARIVIPGKSLKKGRVPDFAACAPYPDSCPAAMVDVRDVSSEMLQYLLEEADSIKEETDYNYLHSFGHEYYDYISTAFTPPDVFGGSSLKSLYNDEARFIKAGKFRDMMMEYAYLTQGKGAGEEAYKINRAIVEGGIQDINVFRGSIRRAPDNGSWDYSDWSRTQAIEPVSLEGNTVIIGTK